MSDTTELGRAKSVYWQAQKIGETLAEMPIAQHLAVFAMLKAATDLRVHEYQQGELAKQQEAEAALKAKMAEQEREAKFGIPGPGLVPRA